MPCALAGGQHLASRCATRGCRAAWAVRCCAAGEAVPCCCPCLPRPVLGGLAGPVAAALALWRVAHIAGNGRDGGSPWRPTPRRAVRCLSGAQAAAVGCAACQHLAKPVRLIQPGALPVSAAVLVLFAINEIAACACLAQLRGRFGIERPRTKSSASPGQPLARQAMAAPGAFWWPALGRVCAAVRSIQPGACCLVFCLA